MTFIREEKGEDVQRATGRGYFIPALRYFDGLTSNLMESLPAAVLKSRARGVAGLHDAVTAYREALYRVPDTRAAVIAGLEALRTS
jgi:hypothetical protein